MRLIETELQNVHNKREIVEYLRKKMCDSNHEKPLRVSFIRGYQSIFRRENIKKTLSQ